MLRIISRTNIGGPTIHVKNLMEHLDPRRFESKLVFGSLSPTEGDMNYIFGQGRRHHRYLPELQREIHPLMDFVALIKLIGIIEQFGPDIVHTHLSKAGTLGRIAAALCSSFRNRPIKTVHTFHGNVFDGYFGKTKSALFRLVEKNLLRGTDKIIAISDTQKWELSQKYKIAPVEKIEDIGLGFDLSPFFNNSAYKGTLRKHLRIAADTLVIGIVGRMVPIKNHAMFLEASKLLLDRHPIKKIVLLLVGSGELEAKLKQQARNLGIAAHTRFYGWEENIPMIYADLDILALTSLNEGTPVSVIEAIAAAVPVITTGVGGIKDLLGPFSADQPQRAGFMVCQRGILCPNNDPSTFSDALQYMIESGYLNERQRFEQARQYVALNYTIERLVDRTQRLYEALFSDAGLRVPNA